MNEMMNQMPPKLGGGDRTVTSANPAMNKLASAGRFGDTEIAHTTPGEVIIPLDIQDEELMGFIARKFEEYGIPMNRYVVNPESSGEESEISENPETGEDEYFSLGGIFKSILPAAASMIPGVGQIAGPLVGAAMNGMGGSGSSGSSSGSGMTTANLSSLPNAVQADIAAKPSNPFKASRAYTLDGERTPNTFGKSPTPPLSQDIEEEQNAINPQTGMREYFSMTDRPAKDMTLMGTDMQRPKENKPRYGSSPMGDMIRGAFKGGTNGKVPTAPQNRKGMNGNIPPMRRANPSINPHTGKPEYAGVAASTPTVIGVKGQPAPTAGGSYQTNFVKSGAVDLTPFTNSGVPRVKGANNSTVAVPLSSAEVKPAETTPEVKPAETQATTTTTPAATNPYVDEQYFGPGRNERETEIQKLGYSGPFGKGVADAWLNNKYGTTDLNQIPRVSTQVGENNTQVSDPYQSAMDRINSLIEKYLSASSTSSTAPVTPTSTSPQASASALSPYRPPRFRSRRFRGSISPNFAGA